MPDDPTADQDRADGARDGTRDDSAEGSGADRGADREAPGDSQSKSALEWIVTGVGALLVAGVLGFFVYQWIVGSDGPADLRVSLGTPEPKGQTVEVPVEVENVGETVAQAAVVEVCAGDASCAQLTFDYVPRGSTVTGTVGLAGRADTTLTSRVVSFVEP